MKWVKKGQIFVPKKQKRWIRSHAAVPVAVHMGGNDYRVFFGSRNRDNKTQTGYIDVEVAKDGIHLLYISPTPVLELGKAGRFDDSAAWASSMVQVEKELWHMYYIGWTQGVSVPYVPTIGLATSPDLETFTKAYDGPIIGRDVVDPYGCSSMSVMFDPIERYPFSLKYKMWYLSIIDYVPKEDMYYYGIRCAASEDGLEWIKFEGDGLNVKLKSGETRIARPCVIKDFAILYRMWYCYASKKYPYRIGYAESVDGVQWTRKDEEGFGVSPVGWDSEMVCYPFVFEHNCKKYMLYNGNEYGKTGIGYAVLE